MSDLQRVFDALLEQFGPQHWWPGETPFEVMVGAVLTQNTSWKNVERAIESLRAHGALEPAVLDRLPLDDVAEMIRPAGYYRLKARRLKNLVHYLMVRYDGSVEALAAVDPETARRELLEINGIGPETADSILLYALEHPVFVADAYTARLAVRHGWLEPPVDYATLQSYFRDRLPADTSMLNELHALIVRLGKDYCRSQPKCEGCPLAPFLPAGGPCL